ncbi:hypothetical protein Pint_17834 [Pistacia integerrima]|uniref:Uncharacterized protein n=1 Tax=Pistacia integerrima TaxID=434235 RepID=A0ACC0YWE3_9ROSI|nr:hypothetical protein Pint_17834 [Pistacia integerrima]
MNGLNIVHRECLENFKQSLLSFSHNICVTYDMQDEDNKGLVEEEEEADEEPIFVLIDEWREFFAASEAKRKLG